MATNLKPHLAILGSGPTGLEAALAAVDAGLPFTVYETASEVAGHIRSWGHVHLFTPWSMNVSPRMRRHLEAAGATVPGGADCPSGRELVEHLLAPIAALPAIAPHVRTHSRVVAVAREGLLKHEEISSPARASRPFRLLIRDAAGNERFEHADRVIDATGSYSHPNRLGDGGIPALGELALDDHIRRDIPDFEREAADWAGKTVLLVGGGHSAQTAARDLARFAERAENTRVIWALRSAVHACSASADDGDPLPERGKLACAAAQIAGGSPAFEIRQQVVVEALARENGQVVVTLRGKDGERENLAVDRILALTGFVGDDSIYRQLQIHECYAFAAPMKLSAALLGAAGGGGDCLTQTSHGADTLKNPEPGFFILGIKSYGRNTNFLMRVGWEQVEEVFGLLG